MKRQWRLGRLLLAVILFLLAVCVYSYWPAQLRWSIPSNQHWVVGFQERTGQPISVYHQGSEDLRRNKKQRFIVNKPHECIINAIDLNDGSETHLGRCQCKPMIPYGFQISPKGEFIAFIQNDIQIIDLCNMTSFMLIKNTDEDVAVAFSPNGRYLSVVTNQRIQVWDIQSRSCINEFVVPKQLPADVERALGFSGFSSNVWPESDRIQFNSDGSFLAVAIGNRIGLYDVAGGYCISEVDCQPFMYPRFLPDETLSTVQLMPEKAIVRRYRVNASGLDLIYSDSNEYSSSHFGLSISSEHYLTGFYLPNYRQWPRWLPDRMREILDSILPNVQPKWSISLRDFETGFAEVSTTLPFTESNRAYMCNFFGDGSQPDFQPIVSQNRNWLLVEDNKNIELWPLLTLWRPWSCWLMVVLCSLASLLLGWLSRVTFPIARPGEGRQATV